MTDHFSTLTSMVFICASLLLPPPPPLSLHFFLCHSNVRLDIRLCGLCNYCVGDGTRPSDEECATVKGSYWSAYAGPFAQSGEPLVVLGVCFL